MRRSTVLILAACTFACSTIKELPVGEFEVASAYSVKLGQVWAQIPSSSAGKVRGPILTVDGPLLNRLQLIGALGDGLPLLRLRPTREDQPVPPAFRSGMTDSEVIELITDSLAVEGYQNVKVGELAPGSFGEAPGVRIGLSAATAEGLDISGLALFSRDGEQLNLILYLAPSEYYYGLRLEEVEAIMHSVRML